ncbi:MAG: 4-hydroxythreonine-4-phosphate dehydrogenase PdxA [Pseudomonadota bacterium]
MVDKPVRPIAVSCGEPAGIGPEIIAKAWQELRGKIPFFMIGSAEHLPPSIPSHVIDKPSDAVHAMTKGIPVLPVDFPGVQNHGKPNPSHAAGVVAAIAKGAELAVSGDASALCTAPIHKKSLQDNAGFAFPGHTEFLASLANVDRVVMMLASDMLRVVPVTIHIPVSEVQEALTAQILEETLHITLDGLKRDFGFAEPRLAVAGLNPHAGEGGRMGREEIMLISPVIEKLRTEGADISGPHSADTMFHASARARYDAAICMYHDQALIPIKTLDFDRGVNVTLGLPFVRTSPDHGTALDIAGRDKANPSSMIEALRLAAKMAKARAR